LCGGGARRQTFDLDCAWTTNGRCNSEESDGNSSGNHGQDRRPASCGYVSHGVTSSDAQARPAANGGFNA
jgi:hypothetical protein